MNDYVKYAKKWEHHIDYIVDVENSPEIHSIYDVKVTEK